MPWPPQGLYAKNEIKSVDDLKGLKFRTYNATIGRIAALVGAIPTQIEVPDLPTAFATGRVDVMITSASTGVDTKAQDLSHPLHRHCRPGSRATSCSSTRRPSTS